MKTSHIKTAVILFLSSMCILGCNKVRMRGKCCDGQLEILTESYNHDSVSIFAPNAFTPDNNGINDIFMIQGTGIKSTHLKIYRGLTKVLDANDTERIEWDGHYKEKIRQGIYRYEATLTTIHDEQVEVEGKLCLLMPDGLFGELIKDCISCTFGDMIDPRLGFIYPTGESIPACAD